MTATACGACTCSRQCTEYARKAPVTAADRDWRPCAVCGHSEQIHRPRTRGRTKKGKR